MMSPSNQRPANRGFRSVLRCAISHYHHVPSLSAREPISRDVRPSTRPRVDVGTRRADRRDARGWGDRARDPRGQERGVRAGMEARDGEEILFPGRGRTGRLRGAGRDPTAPQDSDSGVELSLRDHEPARVGNLPRLDRVMRLDDDDGRF